MSTGVQSSSHILWQNEDHTITLIDIPGSISAAQGTPESPYRGLLLSSEPLKTPFPSNEPKTAAATARLAGNTIGDELSTQYLHLIESATAKIGAHHEGDWCLPRVVDHATHSNRSSKRPKLTRTGKQSGSSDSNDRHPLPSDRGHDDLPPDYFRYLVSLDRLSAQMIQLDLSCVDCHNGDVRLQSNCSNRATELIIMNSKASTHIDAIQTFHFPSKSTFALTNCSESRLFHTFIRSQAQTHGTRQQFDMVILDPPWPNRSVERAHKTPGTSYANSPTLADVQTLILGTDLDMLMSDRCLVGMWITNKPALRELVLGENGIFDSWGVTLLEEWIWLKSTTDGQPISLLNSLWRKPYEVLLLGRRSVSRAPDVALLDDMENLDLSKPRRRVVVGVPDLHSRKPCLKALVEPLLPNQEDPRILEVFARNLVAGWWSWGDECIKFNWRGCWSGAATTDQEEER